jgi:hypothetical protein
MREIDFHWKAGIRGKKGAQRVRRGFHLFSLRENPRRSRWALLLRTKWRRHSLGMPDTLVHVHRLSTCVFILSLAVWLLAVAVYVRSIFRADVIIIYTPAHHCLEMISLNGSIVFDDLSPWPQHRGFRWTSRSARVTFSLSDAFEGRFDPLERADYELADFSSRTQGWGNGTAGLFSDAAIVKCSSGRIKINRSLNNPFELGHLNARLKMQYRVLYLPTWLLPVTGSVVPALFLCKKGIDRLRRRFRRRRGLCIKCAYDLRQSPTRCPECGTSLKG